MRYILDSIKLERKDQDARWGEQNHPPYIWLTILGEEVGEANVALLKADFGKEVIGNYREELVQIAAVAVAAIESLDRNEFIPGTWKGVKKDES